MTNFPAIPLRPLALLAQAVCYLRYVASMAVIRQPCQFFFRHLTTPFTADIENFTTFA